MPKTKEQKKKEIESGEAEENIYSEEGREEMFEEDDELTDIDEGFMKGYEEGAKSAKCPVCGQVVEYDFVEREIDDDVYRFCSEEHADLYMKKINRRREHRRV
ncbi:MAG: hypothetical protein ABIH63_01780 [archaeon]